jgi:7-cyano-7-deazaguanine synthase
MKSAVILFSGGIDSTTALYWALDRSEKVFPLTFDYGQRHKVEISMSRKICRKLRLPQTILKIDLSQIGGSALTDTQVPLPEFDRTEEIGPGLPLTYVPFRNGIFLALASAWAEVHRVKEIICGFNVIDSPNYPDTRRNFVEAMENAINTGTKAAFSNEKIKIAVPFIHLKKSEIIKTGLSLGADYSYSISCYSGKEIPCSKCSSCLLRQKAWEEVGVSDPLLQRLEKEGKI